VSIAYNAPDGTPASMRAVELDGMYVRGQFLVRGSTVVPVIIGTDGSIPVEAVPAHSTRNTTGMGYDQSKVSALVQKGTSICLDVNGNVSIFTQGTTFTEDALMGEEQDNVTGEDIRSSFMEMLAPLDGGLIRSPVRKHVTILRLSRTVAIEISESFFGVMPVACRLDSNGVRKGTGSTSENVWVMVIPVSWLISTPRKMSASGAATMVVRADSMLSALGNTFVRESNGGHPGFAFPGSTCMGETGDRNSGIYDVQTYAPTSEGCRLRLAKPPRGGGDSSLLRRMVEY
jgi:hypothetical protein